MVGFGCLALAVRWLSLVVASFGQRLVVAESTTDPSQAPLGDGIVLLSPWASTPRFVGTHRRSTGWTRRAPHNRWGHRQRMGDHSSSPVRRIITCLARGAHACSVQLPGLLGGREAQQDCFVATKLA